MKRILLLILAGLVAVSCNDDEKIIGSERTFTVKSTTSDWPRNTYGAISRTYEVVTAGASGGWTARLLDGQQGFVLETDEAASTFTVSIGENTGMVNLEDKVCVTYGGEMIYLSLLQISNYFSVSPGKDVGGGIYKYTVGDDGISTYTGTIVNPGTGSVSVTWVSGSEVFTPVLSPAEKPTSLSFTAPANVTFFPNEALFAVAVSDKPDQTVQIAVYQPGLQVPMGALPETEAPGGYYYPLVCGIDVAGVNIPVDPNATWNDVFDPRPDIGAERHVEESDGSRQSLPRGLERADRGPDEAYHGTGELDVRQVGRSCGPRLFLLEHARRRPQRLRDLRRHAHESGDPSVVVRNARQCAAAGVAHAGQPQFQSERQGFECGPYDQNGHGELCLYRALRARGEIT